MNKSKYVPKDLVKVNSVYVEFMPIERHLARELKIDILKFMERWGIELETMETGLYCKGDADRQIDWCKDDGPGGGMSG